jgi:hypothetical protein
VTAWHGQWASRTGPKAHGAKAPPGRGRVADVARGSDGCFASAVTSIVSGDCTHRRPAADLVPHS